MDNIYKSFEGGSIYTLSDTISSESIDFVPHPKFKGVFLKHLVTGKMTNNQISCHLVKVEPYSELELHTHNDNLEIHEIIAGNGTCYIAEKKVTYSLGTVAVIPANVPHKVTAGAEGIYILAKFTPALV
ncbi:MAG: cupin domain-containing protein [Bacillota bacterium]|nr:cupin domain-containing protein [Bacillota bacterium]